MQRDIVGNDDTRNNGIGDKDGSNGKKKVTRVVVAIISTESDDAAANEYENADGCEDDAGRHNL
jgi:hypothetical protein